MQRPIYLDYMATTPVDPRVLDLMIKYLGPTGDFGNAASTTHVYGQAAARAVDIAREQIATVVGATVDDIVFTSGATESINLAILGAARFYQRKGKHVVTMLTEHKAVLDSFKQLEREGFRVTYLMPEPDGLLNLNTLAEALCADTMLVSIMHVNNEIGVIQDLKSISDVLKNQGIIFHVDAAQSAGKVAIDVKELNIDLMSLSAHKNYGPKGIGALYVRHQPRIRLQALIFGGGQEQGLRSGTLATHQIVGMGEAFELSAADLIVEQQRILTLRQKLWNAICHYPNIQLNGHPTQRIAGNLNFSIHGLEGSQILLELSDFAISTISACAAAHNQPSYVLRALGLSREVAQSSIRLAIGRMTTEAEIDYAIVRLQHLVDKT